MRPQHLLLIGLISLTATAAAVIAADSQSPPQDNAAWVVDYDQAIAASKRSGKPIMAYFTGSDWCHWCARFDKEVLETPAFEKWAADHVVLLKLDFPRRKQQSDEIKKQNMHLKNKYDVKGFPAVLFLDHQGQVVAKTGYRPGGADAWIKHVDKMLAHHAAKS